MKKRNDKHMQTKALFRKEFLQKKIWYFAVLYSEKYTVTALPLKIFILYHDISIIWKHRHTQTAIRGIMLRCPGVYNAVDIRMNCYCFRKIAGVSHTHKYRKTSLYNLTSV